MSPEDTFQAYLDAFNRSDAEALAKLYAAKTRYENPFSGEPLESPEAVAAFERPTFHAFGEVSATLEEIIVSGDRVAARVTVHARHTADMQTPGGVVRATGRTVALRTAEFVRVDANGHIVEHHRIFDSASFMAQLGLGTG